MADAEDLKSSGDFSSCGFDSHPGHHFFKENPHLDHGYAVTSHSSQGQTADRVLVNVDTEKAGEKLINRRLAYVAVSRARYDAQIYTNDKSQMTEQLSRDVSHRSAIEFNLSRAPESSTKPKTEEVAASKVVERSLEHGLNIER